MSSLSAIVPVYNAKDYLESCVASISAVNAFCKTAFIREIILVDDGSSDGSSELCDKLAGKSSADCTIRAIHQKNSGVSAARNAGMRAATGTFILFVDSDDTLVSQKLAELMEIVAQDDSIDMVVFGMSFDYYYGDRIYRRDTVCPHVEGKKTLEECRSMMRSLFNSNSLSTLCNKMIRRSIIENAGICLREDMFLYEDLEFSLRILEKCSMIFFCAEPIYCYRQSPDEGNAGRRLRRVRHISEIVDEIENALAPFDGTDDILLSLNLILAREKIRCANKKETVAVCDDFRTWIDHHGLKGQIETNRWAMQLYEGKTMHLFFQREKNRARHSLANWVKRMVGDFRKW